jgi:hypothetical protein
VLDEVSRGEELSKHVGGFFVNRAGRESGVNRVRWPKALDMRPRAEVVGGIDRAVVTEAEECAWVNLEVEVRRGGERVTGVTNEADYLPGTDLTGMEGDRRESGKVCVVELVAKAVPEPDSPSPDGFPADVAQGPCCDCDDRGSERSEDVVAVVPVAGYVATEGAIAIAIGVGTGDREDVSG